MDRKSIAYKEPAKVPGQQIKYVSAYECSWGEGCGTAKNSKIGVESCSVIPRKFLFSQTVKSLQACARFGKRERKIDSII
jgi:hypothetical protein